MKKIALLLLLGFFSTVNAQNIAIIGGGIAGVSSALEIKKEHPNAKIIIFEKEPQLGGNAFTISCLNEQNEEVFIDLGPQYFTEGPWDNYISLLKSHGLLTKDDYYSMQGSFHLFRTKSNARVFRSPTKKVKREQFKRLMKFFKMYKSARKIYLANDPNYKENVGQWIGKLDIDNSFKNEVIYPFLAATLGTDVSNIKKTDTQEIVKLFAFNRGTKKTKYHILKNGMGNAIISIAKSLESKGITIKSNGTVTGLSRENNFWQVHINERLFFEDFDEIVFAIHPYQAKSIVENTHFDSPPNDWKKLANVLGSFQYFEANIVLHRDSSVLGGSENQFMKIEMNDKNEIIQSTMNLGAIDIRYKNIFKSWMTTEMKRKIKKSGLLIAEKTFYHPLITPAFKQSLIELHKFQNSFSTIHFAGGWTEGLETQETAILSGKRVAQEI